MTDIPFAQGAEHGVANGVHQHVRIRMTIQALAMMNIHAAEDEFAPFDQTVHVVANAHVNHGRQCIGNGGQVKCFRAPSAGNAPPAARIPRSAFHIPRS